ncbi:MAG: DMT family transporter [Paracoccaceae bacterium]
MNLWITLSLAAAFFQTLRFMLQRQLSLNTLSASGTTFARFLYSAPIVAVLLAIYLNTSQQAVPNLGLKFWVHGAVGGVAQILATVALVLVFKARNFAVGVTFAKTEVMLSAVTGLVFLGDVVNGIGFVAIGIGLWGVLLLSVPPDGGRFRLKDMMNRAALLGLSSGALFAVSAVMYRGASLAVDLDDPLARAGVTLSAVTAMQMSAMAVWLKLREPGQISAVWGARNVAIWVGVLSMAGSFCWFTAFTLQNAAYVKAVGQVELILSLVASLIVFRERISRREWIGMGILMISILTLVLTISG